MQKIQNLERVRPGMFSLNALDSVAAGWKSLFSLLTPSGPSHWRDKMLPIPAPISATSGVDSNSEMQGSPFFSLRIIFPKGDRVSLWSSAEKGG